MKQGSAIIILNDEKQLLLQHRDSNAPTDKHTWALWGGGKEGEETPKETAVRELKEELNISVNQNDLALFKTFIVSHDNVNKKEVNVFVLHDVGDFTFELHEGDDLRYFSPQEILELPLDFVAQRVLPDYLGVVM